MKKNAELMADITALMELAVLEENPLRALGYLEQARKLMQDLYYQLWMRYHNSGTVHTKVPE